MRNIGAITIHTNEQPVRVSFSLEPYTQFLNPCEENNDGTLIFRPRMYSSCWCWMENDPHKKIVEQAIITGICNDLGQINTASNGALQLDEMVTIIRTRVQKSLPTENFLAIYQSKYKLTGKNVIGVAPLPHFLHYTHRLKTIKGRNKLIECFKYMDQYIRQTEDEDFIQAFDDLLKLWHQSNYYTWEEQSLEGEGIEMHTVNIHGSDPIEVQLEATTPTAVAASSTSIATGRIAATQSIFSNKKSHSGEEQQPATSGERQLKGNTTANCTIS